MKRPALTDRGRRLMTREARPANPATSRPRLAWTDGRSVIGCARSRAAGGYIMGRCKPLRLKRCLRPMSSIVRSALREHDLMDAYRARPQRNDSIGWITRAVRPETRLRRLAVMLEELAGEARHEHALREVPEAVSHSHIGSSTDKGRWCSPPRSS